MDRRLWPDGALAARGALGDRKSDALSGEVERLTAWLVRQTGVRLDTLKQHYMRWWPRDREAIRATYALLDPTVSGQIGTGSAVKSRKPRD